ncbi:MAG: M48 family metallopeptidase [Pelomonas sp.]|nr:M48 family metallopeptidase [Roseateles sp.]
MDEGADGLRVDFFDGRSPRARPAVARLAAGRLTVECEGSTREFDRASVAWPERQRHGQRQALLPGGGLLSSADAAAWDAWAARGGLRERHVARWIRSWRLTLLALGLVGAAAWASWRWGLPALSDAAVAALPASVDAQIGAQSLALLDQRLLEPSALPAVQRQAIAARFARLAAPLCRREGLQYRLQFRAAPKSVGPNAFALPGGDIVVTDALVDFLKDAPDAVMGVLGHELGHVERRHATRMLVRSSFTGAFATLLFGDVSTLLAGSAGVVMEMAYSREFEHQADVTAYGLLRDNGIPPRVMATFFERIAKTGHAQGLPIAIASHPADADRIAFFSH